MSATRMCNVNMAVLAQLQENVHERKAAQGHPVLGGPAQ